MFENAMKAFGEALGPEHVLVGDAAISRYRVCTQPITRRIAAAVRPESVEQVQEIVRIAAAHRLALYPISTGNNWGYGSAQPMRDDNVILDLGRMNRIHEVNTELAY